MENWNLFLYNKLKPQINKINIKKATGIDQISPKILKIAKHAVVAPITQLINLSMFYCRPNVFFGPPTHLSRK
jgi:hypothetical protein